MCVYCAWTRVGLIQTRDGCFLVVEVGRWGTVWGGLGTLGRARFTALLR
jgi:hypothetical protein